MHGQEALTLDDLGRGSAEDAGDVSAPPQARIARSLLRAARDERTDVSALFEHLTPVVRELLDQPGGRKRFAALVRHTLVVRRIDLGSFAEHVRRIIGQEAGEVVMSTARDLKDKGPRKAATTKLAPSWRACSARGSAS